MEKVVRVQLDTHFKVESRLSGNFRRNGQVEVGAVRMNEETIPNAIATLYKGSPKSSQC